MPVSKDGVYKVPAVRVALVREGRPVNAQRPIDRSTAAALAIAEALGDYASEGFVVVGLSSQNRMVALSVVAIGGIASCAFSPSEVLRAALLMACPAFIVGHNHPSGDPTPTREDVEVTRKLIEGGRAVGLSLLDHVIVTPEGGPHRSLRDLDLSW